MSTIIIQRLAAQLGLDVDEDSFRALDESLGRLRGMATAVGAAVGVAAGATWAWAQSAAQAGDDAAKTARQIGITTEAYQELSYAAGLGGVRQEELRAGMLKLSRAAELARQGNAGLAEAFGQLGIDVASFAALTPDQQLERLADAMASIEDPGRRAALSMQLLEENGPRFASMFMGGAEGIRQLRQEAVDLGAVIGHDAAVEAETFNDQLARLQVMSTGVKNTVGLALMPVIIEVIDRVRGWFAANREVIQSKLSEWMTTTARAAFGLIEMVVRLVGWVGRAVDAFGGWLAVLAVVRFALLTLVGMQVYSGILALVRVVRSAIAAYRLLGVTALIAQASALALPLAVGAAFALLVLFIQDFITWMRGGDSLVGRFVDKWAEAPGVLGTVARAFLWLRENLPYLLDAARMMVTDLWAAVSGGARSAWAFVAGITTSTIAWIRGAFDATVAFFVGAWEMISGAASAAWAFIAGVVEVWMTYVSTVIGIVVGIITGYWSAVAAGWSVVVDGIGVAAEWIGNVLGTVFGFVRDRAISVFEFIAGGIAGIVDGLLGLAQTAGDVLGLSTDGIQGARDRVAELQATVAGPAVDGAALQLAARPGSVSGSVSVGTVQVQVEGSTGMGPAELAEATRAGTNDALQQQLATLGRSLQGGER